MALALVICGLSGRAAMAQDGFGGPAYGVPSGVYGPGYGYGTFGPGYPGFGLEYGCGCGSSFPLIHRELRQSSVHAWGAYVLGKECLYPYVADPYSDPRAALGFWPPYSAPVAGAAR
jgi:hypothetical protein